MSPCVNLLGEYRVTDESSLNLSSFESLNVASLNLDSLLVSILHL